MMDLLSLEDNKSSNSSSKNSKENVSPLLSQILFVLLDNLADKMYVVISSYLPLCPSDDTEINIDYLPFEQRYGFNEDVLTKYFEKIKLKDDTNDFTRLQQITKLVLKLSNILASEILETGNFFEFQRVLSNLQLLRQDEIDILTEEKNNYRKYKCFLNDWNKEKNGLINRIRKADDNIEFMKHKEDENTIQFAVQSVCVKKWENSRQEMNLWKYKIVHKDSVNKINKFKGGFQDEVKCHNNITKFLHENVDELQKEIYFWRIKYENDLVDLEQRITRVRLDVDVSRTKKMHVLSVMAKTKAEMDKWIRQKLRMKVQKRAAVKIQQWWKALLKKRLEEKMEAMKKKKQKKKKTKKTLK